MNRIFCLFLATTLLVSVALAGQSQLYEVSLRYNDQDVHALQVKVLDGQVQQVSLNTNLQLELSSGSTADGNGSTVIQLMRNSNLEILHTARQTGLDVDIRRIAYVVCGDQVTFISPTPSDLPTCNN